MLTIKSDASKMLSYLDLKAGDVFRWADLPLFQENPLMLRGRDGFTFLEPGNGFFIGDFCSITTPGSRAVVKYASQLVISNPTDPRF